MVMADGLLEGQTYDSLSKVAFVSPVQVDGRRFFGLRDKEDRSAMRPRHEGDFGQYCATIWMRLARQLLDREAGRADQSVTLALVLARL